MRSWIARVVIRWQLNAGVRIDPGFEILSASRGGALIYHLLG